MGLSVILSDYLAVSIGVGRASTKPAASIRIDCSGGRVLLHNDLVGSGLAEVVQVVGHFACMLIDLGAVRRLGLKARDESSVFI